MRPGTGRPNEHTETAARTDPHHKDQVNTDRSGSISSGSAPTAAVSSQQVGWWEVHKFVAPLIEQAGPAPMAGTPEWCALDDADPVKTAALLDAAQHWALRLETCQQIRCDASREVSDAADWAAIAIEIFQRYGSAYIPREVAS
jgi:hypothetical protein